MSTQWRSFAAVVFLVGSVVWRLQAERLPLHVYTPADGLTAEGEFGQMMQDSRRFLWFVTLDGVTRFDGQSSRSYGAKDGLLGVQQMIQAATGDYWVATTSGLVHYQPEAAPERRFERVAVGQSKDSNQVYQLADDGQRGLWISTAEGIYHRRPSVKNFKAELVFRSMGYASQHLLVDRGGALWFGAHNSGVHRIRPDGAIESYGAEEGLPRYTDEVLVEGRDGRIWMGARDGLLELDPRARPGAKIVRQRIDTLFGTDQNIVYGMCATTDGELWLATGMGLVEYDGKRVRLFSRKNGLSQDRLSSILSDRDGNLWLGTPGAGVMRFNRYGFTSFGEDDGAAEDSANSILAFPTGEVAAVVGPPKSYALELWTSEAQRFRRIQPRFPVSVTGFGVARGSLLVGDHLGESWIPTHDGLARFPATRTVAELDGLRPSKIFTVADGLPSNNVASAYEDARGDIWIALRFPPKFALARWVRSLDRIEDLTDTMPPWPSRMVTSYAQSPSGSMWFGMGLGGVARYKDGVFRIIPAGSQTVGSHVRDVYSDAAGVVWGSTLHDGFFRIDDGDSEHPRVTHFRESEGLAGARGGCLTGDSMGRVYLGSSNGVDRLDPTSGAILHLGTRDGLPSGVLMGCTRDAAGQLWFNTDKGLARLPLAPTGGTEAPPAMITAVEVADHPLALPDLGSAQVEGPVVAAGQNRLQIGFGAVSLDSLLRYRYKLGDTDAAWSKPAALPMVIYPNLRPGKYRFLVQTVSRGVGPGGAPASFTFTILPPIWQRWWFLLLAAAVVAGATYWAYRYRLEQLLAVERLRTRIATDLHDDIGSALSQIALLSEGVRRNVTPGDDGVAAPLERIAEVARETTAVMSDIVWAINPERDSLGDLSVRVRRFATDVFSARDIDCAVITPESDEELKLGIEMRRQLLLMIKEAIHNAVRHAGCTEVRIELMRDRGALVFRMADNGVGFDTGVEREGHGLGSMRARARKLGGEITIESGSEGTRLEFRGPA